MVLAVTLGVAAQAAVATATPWAFRPAVIAEGRLQDRPSGVGILRSNQTEVRNMKIGRLPLQGRCGCGAVRFEVSAPLE
jgi:hypothetical protein